MSDTAPRTDLYRAAPRGVELRASDEGIGTLTGHFSVFDQWYEVNSLHEGHFMERIAPGAWAQTIAEDRARMRVTFNHGQDPQLGDKVLGPIESLEEDDIGARYSVPLFDTSFNRDLLPGLRAGVYGSSMRFNVEAEDWERNAARSASNPEGLPERTITRGRVAEFGPVTFPANAGATAGVRSITDQYRPAPVPEPTPAPSRQEVNVSEPTEAVHPSERPARIADLQRSITEFAATHAGVLPADEQARFDEMTSELERHKADATADEQRKAIVAALADRQEPETVPTARASAPTYGAPQVIRQRVDDIYSFTEIRAASRNQEDERQLLRDSAMRSLEGKTFPHPKGDPIASQDKISRLLAKDTKDKELAKRMLVTGNPAYERAFQQAVANMEPGYLTQHLQRYAALEVVGTTTTGGYMIPYAFDPTMIHTGAYTNINPYRVICRTESIVGANRWEGVSVGAVLAAYDGESDATTEGGPTFARPAMTAQRASAFVTLSRETTDDRPDVVAELSALISEAKDTLEENQFSVGVGTTFFPLGMFVKSTFTVKETITDNTFAVADLDATEAALPIRHRRDAVWMLSRAVIRTVQGFETAYGKYFNSTLGYPAVGNPENNPGGNTGLSLLGYPVWETPSAPVTITGDDTIVGILVSPKNYMILDRVGLDVELIPHMFDATTGLPNGTRGLLAIWRNTARALNADAGRQININ